MIIVCEGCDGSGKTTFVKRFSEEVTVPLMVISRPRRFTTLSQFAGFNEWLTVREKSHVLLPPLLLDRHPLISEYVYGPIFREKEKLLQQNSKSIVLNVLHGSGEKVHVVYCRPPIEVIKERAKKLPQMRGVHEHLTDLCYEYDNLMDKFPSDSITTYDGTNPSFLDIRIKLGEQLYQESKDGL